MEGQIQVLLLVLAMNIFVFHAGSIHTGADLAVFRVSLTDVSCSLHGMPKQPLMPGIVQQPAGLPLNPQVHQSIPITSIFCVYVSICLVSLQSIDEILLHRV